MNRVALGIFVPLILAADGAVAQVTVDFEPDTIRVRPEQAGEAFLSLMNGGDAPVRGLQIEWLTPDSISVALRDPLPEELGSQESVGTVLVFQGQARAAGERAFLRVSFRSASGTRKTVVSSAWLAPHTPAAASDVVDVEILTSLEALTDGDAGSVHLLVKNKSELHVRVDTVRSLGPSFITFEGAERVEIPPRDSRLIRIDLRAADWVRPGKHLLFFYVPLAWSGPEGRAQGTLILSREVEVGVLGESEILQLLAVPSFLLLPGFLMVVTFGMLRRRMGATEALADDPKKPQFWLVAVGLSLLWVVVLPALGGRNYLKGYGIRDIAWVWFVSVLLALVAALLVAAVKSYLARRAARELADRTPTPEDKPVEILRKLHRLGIADVRLSQVEFEHGGAQRRGFLLAKHAADGKTWVAPGIQYQWKTAASSEARSKLEDSIQANNLAALADAMVDVRDQLSVLAWAPEPGFAGPTAIASEGFQTLGRRLFVFEA